MKDIICRGNEEVYEYLISWMARAVQQPDEPGFSAVVLRGSMGTGKSIFVKIFGSLFGRHFLQVSDSKHVTGHFNAHLRDCVVLFGEEAFYAGDKRHESTLKMLVTEDMIPVEPKGVDVEMSANCVHLMMASNEHWVVPAAVDDRRFFVLDVASDRKEDHTYFGALQAQVDSGGREALLHLLINRDLRGFNVRKIPRTAALQEQKIHSLGVEEEWWYTKLREGRLLTDHPHWIPDVCTIDFTNDFIDYSRRFGVGRRGNATKLEYSIRRFCPALGPVVSRDTPIEVEGPDGRRRVITRPYYYQFPSLEKCRAIWDEKFGGPYSWSSTTTPSSGTLNGFHEETPF